MGYPLRGRSVHKDPEAHRPATITGIETLFEAAPRRHEDYEKDIQDAANKVRGDRKRQISTRILLSTPNLLVRISDDAKVEKCNLTGEDGVEKLYVRVAWLRGHDEWGHICLHTTDEIKAGDTVLCRKGFLLCRRVRSIDAKTRAEVGRAAYYLSVDGEDIMINSKDADLPADTSQCWLIKGEARSLESPILGEKGHWQIVLTHYWIGGLRERPEEIERQDRSEDRSRRPQYNERSQDSRPQRPQLSGPNAAPRPVINKPQTPEKVEVVKPPMQPEAPAARPEHKAPPATAKAEKKTPVVSPTAKASGDKKPSSDKKAKPLRLDSTNGNPFAALGTLLAPTNPSAQE